jgi:Reverse transcriptase (RNA-dependent DNA polymerase)
VEKYHGEHKTREVFKLMRNINRQWQPRQVTIRDENNKVLTEEREILERWTRYCSSLYKEQRDETAAKELIETLEKITPRQEDIPNDDDILYEEVEWAIRRLKENKSPGVDKVTGEMLKYGGPQVIDRLHQICNKAWRTGIAPEIWKKSILITIHKKGSPQECKNYRTIALISHVGKVLMAILNRRLQGQMEEHLADEQAGFRKDRGTVQQILALRLVAEKARRKGKKIYNCFVDFQKAFDSIDQRVAWAVMKSYGVNDKLVRIIQDINDNAMAAVRIKSEMGEWFRTNKGTRQGDPISPEVFITDLERAMDNVKENCKGISVQGLAFNNLRFADDIDIIEENVDELEKTVRTLATDSKPYGLVVNTEKTKTMVFGSETIEQQISLDGERLENVKEFVYLGSTFTYDLNCKREVTLRFARAKAALAALDKIWKSKEVSLKTKLAVLDTCVFSGALYACETWVITKEIERRILAFERKCYRKVLRVGWRRKMTNEQLYEQIGIRDTLLQKVIRRKLQLFGHICRMDDSRKLKALVFGIMEGTNKRGRPFREWKDDIAEWCGGKSLQQLSHIARERDNWREMIKGASSTYGR